MKKYLITGTTILSVIIFQSCSSDDDSGVDTQKPVIILNVPTEHQGHTPGEDFHVEADFVDNVELGSYKLEIHSAEDGHTHKGPQEGGEWFYTQSVQINPGLKNMSIHEHIPIPTEVDGVPIAEGHYHLGIFLTDKAGNEQQLFTEIVIGADPDH